MNKKLKLSVCYLGTRGGGVFDTCGIIEALSEIPDLDVTAILSMGNPVAEKLSGVESVSLHLIKTNSPSIKSLFCQSFLFKWVAFYFGLFRSKPEIVLITMFHPWMMLIPSFMRVFLPKAKWFYIRHNPPKFESVAGKVDSVLQKCDDYLTRNACLVFTFSRYVRSEIIKAHLRKEDEIRFIGFGLHQSFQSVRSGWAHKGFSKGDEPLRILFFGRILPYKGTDVLMNAFRLLRRRGRYFRLTIAGEGDLKGVIGDVDFDDPCLRVINRWVSDDELRDLFSQTDVIVAPYVRASQSGPVNLGVTFGIPLIVSDAGGLPELVRSGETGLVVEAGSVSSLVAAMESIIKNPQRLPQMSNATKEFGAKELTWRSLAERMRLNF